MSQHKIARTSFILLWLLVSLTVSGQQVKQSSAKSGKVGLVLSGGGARGFAHIGILMAFEQEGIPIDYITGTSAGALIGSLYASGLTPWEIEQAAINEIGDVLSPGLSVNESYYYNRDRVDPSFVTIPIKWDASMASISDNLVSDFEINKYLVKLLWASSAACKNDFDSLFVPFRATASSLLSREAVYIRSGNLPYAIRASIAAPLFFTPATGKQYRNLFDGGVYDNFPVKPMVEDFKPEFIIGVHVGTPPPTSKEVERDYRYLEVLLSKSLDNRMAEALPAKNSVFIAPDLDSIGPTDFSKSPLIIKRGYEAAMKAMPKIKALIARRQDLVELNERRIAFHNQTPRLELGRMTVHDVLSAEQRFSELQLFTPLNTPVDINSIFNDYLRLKQNTKFNSAFLELNYQPDSGFYTLDYFVRPSSNLTVSAGLSVFGPSLHNIYLSGSINNYRIVPFKARVEFNNGSFINSLGVSTRVFFGTKTNFFLQGDYLTKGWGLRLPVTTNFSWQSEANILQGFGKYEAKLGYNLDYRGAVTLGYHYYDVMNRFFESRSSASLDSPDENPWAVNSLHATYEYNTTNKKQYATRGSSLYASFFYSSGREIFRSGSLSFAEKRSSHNWFQFRTEFRRHRKLIGKSSWGYSLQAAGSSLSNSLSSVGSQLMLPRFVPLPDSRLYFLDRTYARLWASPGVMFDFPINNSLSFRTEGYYMHDLSDLLDDYDNLTESAVELVNYRSNFSAMAGFTYQTILGPIGVFLMAHPYRQEPFILNIHLGYMLFGRSYNE